MKSKLFIFLLLLNFITTLSVGYIIYDETSNKKPTIIEIEPPIGGDIDELLAVDKEFKTNVYNGMGRLIYGQNMINLRLFALHHYIKPHDEGFIEGCPECELEKQKILQEDKESVTFLGPNNGLPTGNQIFNYSCILYHFYLGCCGYVFCKRFECYY